MAGARENRHKIKQVLSSGSPVVSPITISDSLPVGLTATEILGENAYERPAGSRHSKKTVKVR